MEWRAGARLRRYHLPSLRCKRWNIPVFMRGNVPVTGALLWFSAGSTALITRSIVAHSCTTVRLYTYTRRHILLCEPHSSSCSKIVHRLSHAPLWSISFFLVDLEGLPSILLAWPPVRQCPPSVSGVRLRPTEFHTVRNTICRFWSNDCFISSCIRQYI